MASALLGSAATAFQPVGSEDCESASVRVRSWSRGTPAPSALPLQFAPLRSSAWARVVTCFEPGPQSLRCPILFGSPPISAGSSRVVRAHVVLVLPCHADSAPTQWPTSSMKYSWMTALVDGDSY